MLAKLLYLKPMAKTSQQTTNEMPVKIIRHRLYHKNAVSNISTQ